MGWFNMLMTEFIVACMAGYYFSPIHIPFLLPPYSLPLSTPATQAKFMVGRKLPQVTFSKRNKRCSSRLMEQNKTKHPLASAQS